jgi:MFS family permease
VATCTRCGTFLCGDCTELLEEAAYCAACLPLARRQAAFPRALFAALGLGVLGLLAIALSVSGFFLLRFVQPVLAGVSLGLSIRVLRHIRRGEAPRRARALAWFTLTLAVLNVLFFLLGLGLVLTFLYLARQQGPA